MSPRLLPCLVHHDILGFCTVGTSGIDNSGAEEFDASKDLHLESQGSLKLAQTDHTCRSLAVTKWNKNIREIAFSSTAHTFDKDIISNSTPTVRVTMTKEGEGEGEGMKTLRP